MGKILIAAPLWPPEIGGPAQYAQHLEEEFRALGHEVKVVKFSSVRHLPSGWRHLAYFFKILPALWWADWCLAFDVFSVGLPVVAASYFLPRPVVIRTGGDFLWEWYVERTGDLVLLRNFYPTRLPRLSLKEKLVLRLSRWVTRHVTKLVFSTAWQRVIWQKPYRLDWNKTSVIENYYGPKEQSFPAKEKIFLAGTRPLKWKNDARLLEAFRRDHIVEASLSYDNGTVPFAVFMDKLAHCYGVVLVSLGDISPNMILDAVRHNKPFILTRETGLRDRLKDVGIFVDPENVEEIAAKLLWLADEHNYQVAKQKIEQFTFTHTWREIAQEFCALAAKL